MKKQLIYTLFSIGLLLVGCKDQLQTNWDPQPYSKISVEKGTELKSEYVLEQWDTLSISAPKIVQSYQNKPLTYQWKVENQVVSREKNLKYVASNFGVFKAQLMVFNGDSYFLHTFSINVRYKYVEGLYALASLNGKTIISYLPEENSGKSFEQDILTKNNAETNAFTAEPKTLYFSNDTNKLLFVATENPNTILRFDANLMLLKATINTNNEVISSIRNDGSYSYSTGQPLQSSFKMLAIINDRLAEFDANKDYLSNPSQKEIDKMFSSPLTQFCKDILSFVNDRFSLTSQVLFDNAGGRMISYVRSSYPAKPVELYKGTFTNYTAVRLLPASQNNYILAILKKKDDGTFHIFYGLPQENSNNTQLREINNVNDQSQFVTAPKKDILYYSIGDKIYAYSVVSNGNFPDAATFNIDSSNETIADMYVNTDNTKLYIATNDNSSELKGSIYCFDITSNNHTLVWKKKNITGKIIKLDYRYL